jgi:outer membrane cobalamin receptor
VFNTEYENLIDFLFEPDFGLFNRDSVRARGVEIEARIRQHDRLRFSTAWTVQEVEDLATSSELRQRPTARGSLRAEWTVRPALQVAATWLLVDDFADRQLVSDRTDVPGYDLLSLGGRLRLSPRWSLDVQAGNVVDTRHEVAIGFPGPGRSIRLGARWASSADRTPGSTRSDP